ncbi:MAG: 30S ribosomal protein S12 methylthiotransferase RimO [Muribaculaceae bacterium]|nr:30S ribosomal protein S12 methylthiotransferase RimO [Muribaculaceae bacterium]
MKRRKVDIVSLGCSKNLVDSERLMKMLADAGMNPCFEPERTTPGDIVVVNTCGFIGDAKEESVNTILEYADMRTRGEISKLYVMGCLSERYRKELPGEIPEVDGWYGKTDWPGIVRSLTSEHPGTAPYDRIITTPRHHAYLKIAEGCNRFCAFCAIPLITGRYRSRSPQEIEAEVKLLVSRGVKEFNIIAQDLSGYGCDINGGKSSLADLLKRLSDINGVEWLRLHYAYPADFPRDILPVMAERSNICSYLDIALQHISDKMLSAMRRRVDKRQTLELLDEIRAGVPGIHLRTTLMTGFPGEGEAEFEELKEFVRSQRFERMGAFAYCEEEGTYAAEHYEDEVAPEVKQQRLDTIMAIQEEISGEIQESKVGSVLKVMIDREEGDHYIGRTEWDSPEVDPEVLVAKAPGIKCGEFCNVRITGAMPFELIGTVHESE